MLTSRDVLKQGGGSFTGKLSLEMPYDGIPYSENYHIEVTAPTGTQFLPLERNSKARESDRESVLTPFALVRRKVNHDFNDDNIESQDESAVDTIGPMGCYSPSIVRAWSTPRFKSSASDEPMRRIPSPTEPVSVEYSMFFILSVLPKKRLLAFILVPVVSLLYWLMVSLYTRMGGVNDIVNMVVLLCGFVMSAIALYVSLFGDEPHIPRRLYVVPRTLSLLCVAFDYLTVCFSLVSAALSPSFHQLLFYGIPLWHITGLLGCFVPLVLLFIVLLWGRSISIPKYAKSDKFRELSTLSIVSRDS